jgi:hypothetical protein
MNASSYLDLASRCFSHIKIPVMESSASFIHCRWCLWLSVSLHSVGGSETTPSHSGARSTGGGMGFNSKAVAFQVS